MKSRTQLEHLSNEIFFEIFDHLHALHIFTAFTSLNHRISAILHSIPLHVVISADHSRRQVEYLSILSSHFSCTAGHFTTSVWYNSRSLVSYSINITSLIFDHVIVYDIEHSTELTNVIGQLRTLDRLVSFDVYQRYDDILKGKWYYSKYAHAQVIISSFDQSSHSTWLFRYCTLFFDLLNYFIALIVHLWFTLDCICIVSNTNSSSLSFSTLSRHSTAWCRSEWTLASEVSWWTMHFLHAASFERRSNHLFDWYFSASNQVASIDVNDLPTVSQLRSFHLTILAGCNSDSIARVLHCIPNVKDFRISIWRCNANLGDFLLNYLMVVHGEICSIFMFHIWRNSNFI